MLKSIAKISIGSAFFVFLFIIIVHGQDAVEANIFTDTARPVTEVIPVGPAQNYNNERAQTYTDNSLKCPYAFERDLFLGKKGEDVKLLQKLLNSDQRTQIAVSGLGSSGNETLTFGQTTKDAVKKFQALFIEYIGIANGRFGPRTRTVMSAICTGNRDLQSGVPTNVSTNNPANYNTIVPVQTQVSQISTSSSTVTNTDLNVSLSSNINSVLQGETFKVFLNASNEIKKPDASSFILYGGGIKDIRKLGRGYFVISISPNEGVREVTLQVEAEKIEDANGNKNLTASNEIFVGVYAPRGGNIVVANPPTTATQTATTSAVDIANDRNIASAANPILPDTSSLNSLLDRLAAAPTLNTSNAPTTYYCNGQQIPNTQICIAPVQGNTANNTNTSRSNTSSGQTTGQLITNVGIGFLLGNLFSGSGGIGSSGGGLSGIFSNLFGSRQTTSPIQTGGNMSQADLMRYLSGQNPTSLTGGSSIPAGGTGPLISPLGTSPLGTAAGSTGAAATGAAGASAPGDAATLVNVQGGKIEKVYDCQAILPKDKIIPDTSGGITTISGKVDSFILRSPTERPFFLKQKPNSAVSSSFTGNIIRYKMSFNDGQGGPTLRGVSENKCYITNNVREATDNNEKNEICCVRFAKVPVTSNVNYPEGLKGVCTLDNDLLKRNPTWTFTAPVTFTTTCGTPAPNSATPGAAVRPAIAPTPLYQAPAGPTLTPASQIPERIDDTLLRWSK